MKKKKVLIICVIVVLLFVIMFGLFYFKRDKNEFSLFLDRIYEKCYSHKNMKLDMDISISGDISDEYDFELLRDVSISSILNYDLDKDIFLLNFDSNYKGSSIVNGSMYYEKDLYVNLGDLYGSTIKVDDYDLEISGIIDSFYKAISNALDEGDYSSNGDEYTLIINNKNKDKVVKKFVSVLKKNKDLVEIIDKLGIDINDIKISNLDSDIKVVMYTNDDKFVKLLVYEGDKEIGYINPTEKNTKIKLYFDNFKIMTIVGKPKDNRFNITSNIYTKEKSLNLGVNVSYSFDESIEKFNIDNAVKLSEDDKKKIEDSFNNTDGIKEIKKDSEELEGEINENIKED